MLFISYVIVSLKKPAISSLDLKRLYKMIGNYLHIDGVFSEIKRERSQIYIELL